MTKYRKAEQEVILSNAGGSRLHENYVLSFSHYDGFTRDLLSIDLFVDKENSFELIFSSMEKLVNYGSDRFEAYLEGKLPTSIQLSLKNLLSKNLEHLKADYTSIPPGVTGQGEQLYQFNKKNKFHQVTIDTHIDGKLDSLEFKSEKLFFKFNQELNDWLKFVHESAKNNSAYNTT